MERRLKACSYTATKLLSMSSPDKDSEHSNRLKPRLNRLLIYNAPFMLPMAHFVMSGRSKNPSRGSHVEFESADDLMPGDRVVVRSEEEIRSTVDGFGRFKGLGIMLEMANHYGNEYRVFKKVNRLIIESTGELRGIKSPTYILEGVLCTGEFHKNCDRSCFILWKREWLKKVN